MADALRSMMARQAALSRWDRTADRHEATQRLRDGFRARLRADVLEENPGLADEEEIERRITIKLKLHYATMQANSLRTRRAKAAQKRQLEQSKLIDAIIAADKPADDE